MASSSGSKFLRPWQPCQQKKGKFFYAKNKTDTSVDMKDAKWMTFVYYREKNVPYLAHYNKAKEMWTQPPEARLMTEHILVSWPQAARAHISTYKAVAIFLEQWKGMT